MFTPTDPTLAKVVTFWFEIIFNITWGSPKPNPTLNNDNSPDQRSNGVSDAGLTVFYNIMTYSLKVFDLFSYNLRS